MSTLFADTADQCSQWVKTTLAEKPNARRALFTSAAVVAGLLLLRRVTAANST